ncbi:hypothetical protein FRC03_003409 [Tulasnella sp. 419]|nr:hypothetical protein FRC03_003409 [Tulasnella sp. 419]
MRSVLIATAAGLLPSLVAGAYSATYLPVTLPEKTEEGQWGTNQCGTESKQDSNCQNLYINSIDDFCLWAPHTLAKVGDAERETVSYCLRSGYGTRLIPDGTIKGAHLVQTPDYIQITGMGDFTSMNIPKGDAGGELDPHGADQKGNPIGGIVFGTSFGGLQQYHEWTNFMSSTEFCIRGCKDGKDARKFCQHIYDIVGCGFNMPGNYTEGVFESCKGDSTYFPGLYSVSAADGSWSTSTFRQGQAKTPDPHPAAPSSECVFISTVSNQPAVSPTLTYFSTKSVSSATTTPSSSAGGGNVAATDKNSASLSGQAALVVVGMVTGLVSTFLAL